MESNILLRPFISSYILPLLRLFFHALCGCIFVRILHTPVQSYNYWLCKKSENKWSCYCLTCFTRLGSKDSHVVPPAILHTLAVLVSWYHYLFCHRPSVGLYYRLNEFLKCLYVFIRNV